MRSHHFFGSKLALVVVALGADASGRLSASGLAVVIATLAGLALMGAVSVFREQTGIDSAVARCLAPSAANLVASLHKECTELRTVIEGYVARIHENTRHRE